MIDLRQYRANTARRFGSAQHYHVGWIISEDGRSAFNATTCSSVYSGDP